MVSTEGGGWGGSLHDGTFMHLNHLLFTIKILILILPKRYFIHKTLFNSRIKYDINLKLAR